jgi:hypothetical protein
MTDDLTLLASTYLDGEATPDERARVEGDAALLAEVERLRNARATLLDARWFERPGDDVRETAIAAALATWDASETGRPGSRAATAPAGRRSPTVTFERRRAYTRWLTAAAAVVAVAGLGVIVAQTGGGDQNDNSTAIEMSASDTSARAESSTEFSEQSEPPSDAADTLASSGIAADDASGGDADAGSSVETPTVAAGTEAPSAPAAPGDVAAEQTALAVMQTPEDLGAVAAEAKGAVENGTNPDVLDRTCGDAALDDIDMYVAMGTYRDRSVIIGIDDEDDRAIAVDPDTCEIVAEAPLP